MSVRQSSFTLAACLLCGLRFQVQMMQAANAQEIAKLSLSRNPVYIGQLVTLTCSYRSGALLSLTVMALNGTLEQGALYCNTDNWTTIDTGVLLKNDFTDIRSASSSKEANLSINATLSHELNYTCLFRVYQNNGALELKSNAVLLRVNVYPSRPQFVTTPLEFNESDGNATIICQSHGGRPIANLHFSISKPRGNHALVIESGGSASLVLTPPLAAWHNATVECTVTNHEISNKTVTSRIVVNHIISIGSPSRSCTHASNVILDCSSFISSHPTANYLWTAMLTSNVTAQQENVEPKYTALQGTFGLLKCTATNNITLKSVAVVFNLDSEVNCLNSPSLCRKYPFVCYGIPVVIFVITVAIIVGILFHRGYFRNDEVIMTENPVYDSGPALQVHCKKGDILS